MVSYSIFRPAGEPLQALMLLGSKLENQNHTFLMFHVAPTSRYWILSLQKLVSESINHMNLVSESINHMKLVSESINHKDIHTTEP